MKKTKIRIFAFVLSTIMAFPIFASCNKENESITMPETTTEAVNDLTEPTVETTAPQTETTTTEIQETTGVPDVTDPTVDVNLSKYNIVISSLAQKDIIYAVSYVYDIVKEKTGKSLYFKMDGKYPVENSNGYEILIGYTDRVETRELVGELEKQNSHWAISLKGNKIVVVGINNFMTGKAIEYFEKTYISEISQDAVIKIPELLIVSENEDDCKIIPLAENGEYNYKTVIKSGISTRDPVAKETSKMVQSFNDLIGSTDMSVGYDNTVYGTNEILIGNINRTEAKKFYSELKLNEYGYELIGEKIVVGGWTRETTILAIELLMSEMPNSVSFDSNGRFGIKFRYGGKVIKTHNSYVAEIPQYNGGVIDSWHDLTDNGIECCVKNTTLGEFSAYCKTLESLGYTKYFVNTIKNNSYATYTSADTMIHVYYTHFEKAVRIVAAPMSTTILPNVKDEAYTKVTEPKVTQMMFEYPNRTNGSRASGMCYIFTLEDGSYIIYDTGETSDTDAKRLYELLCEMNERPDGKIVIAAWVLTHEHGDHYGNFLNFCKKYGKYITLEQFICNTPTTLNMSINESHVSYESDFNAAKQYVGDVKVVKVHTGQVVKIRNAEIEVLFTIEDTYPKFIRNTNDASIITRVKMGGQTVMMLGDTESQTSDIIMSSFGEHLKSDIVQISHHGYGTAPFALYELIDSDIALWPAYQEVYDRLLSPNNTGSYFVLAKQLVESNMFTDIFLADYAIKTLVLPYKAGSGAVIERKY